MWHDTPAIARVVERHHADLVVGAEDAKRRRRAADVLGVRKGGGEQRERNGERGGGFHVGPLLKRGQSNSGSGSPGRAAARPPPRLAPASAVARTPSRRMRRSSGTRFRHSPAARRIACASCVGASSVLVARDRLEVVVAQLEADRPADVALALQIVARRRTHSSVKIARQLRRGRAARDRSRSNVVSRLIDFGSLYGDHGALVAAVRRLVHPGAVVARRTARPATRDRRARARRWCGCRAPRASRSPSGPMPLILRARQRPDARRRCRPGAACVSPSGLSSSDAILASSLFGATPIEHDEARRRAHRVLDRHARRRARAARDRRPDGLARASQFAGRRDVGEVDVDLVDAAVLDVRRDARAPRP